MFNICEGIACFVLLATAAFFIFLLVGKYRHARVVTPLYTLFIGCFVSVFVLMLPLMRLPFAFR